MTMIWKLVLGLDVLSFVWAVAALVRVILN